MMRPFGNMPVDIKDEMMMMMMSRRSAFERY
jgi:hypothetical protein